MAYWLSCRDCFGSGRDFSINEEVCWVEYPKKGLKIVDTPSGSSQHGLS